MPDEARIRIRYFPNRGVFHDRDVYRGEEVKKLQKEGETIVRTPDIKLHSQEEAAKLYKELNFK